MTQQTVVHVYFGNANAHSIVMNYMRCQEGRHHRVLLGKPFGNKFLRLAQLCWRLVILRFQDSTAIVHTHDVVSAVLSASLPFEHVIFDSHEIYASLTNSNFAAKIVAGMERYATRRSRLVIYPSQQRLDFSAMLGKTNRIVIENLFLPIEGALSEAESELLQHMRNRVRSSPGRRFIFAGKISPVRGISELFDVFLDERLSGDSLFIAGKTSELLEQLLEDAPESIQFLGELPHDVMTELLPCFDAGIALYKPINANNRLAAPTKLFEYVYYGLAVIANRSAYVEEIVHRLAVENIHMSDSVTREDVLAACLAVDQRRGPVTESMRRDVSWQSQLPRIEAMYTSVEENRLIRDSGILS